MEKLVRLGAVELEELRHLLRDDRISPREQRLVERKPLGRVRARVLAERGPLL